MKTKKGSIETYRLIAKMNKNDILRLSRKTCKAHNHSYLVHPSCALKEKAIINSKDGKKIILEEKIGFFDIECFSFQFKADMGLILTYCIKELDGNLIKNTIRPREIKNKTDKRLLKQLIHDLKKFTRLVGFYSTLFDIPFVRTRALFYNLDFPLYKEIFHTDIYYTIRNKFSFRSNSLGATCRFFGIPSKSHSFNKDAWFGAMTGNEKDINYVLQHNIEDVISTELLWKKINLFSMENKRSI